MANPYQVQFPIPPPPLSLYFLDPVGRQVAQEDAVVDGLDIWDRRHIYFSQHGDMFYRGKLVSPREQLSALSQQLQDIYYKDFAPQQPQQPGDFTNYRSKNQSSSSSSHGSARHAPPPADGDDAAEAAVVDGSDAAGLLNVPLRIDGAVPLSQAYEQYEPKGYKLIAEDHPIDSHFRVIGLAPRLAAGLKRRKKQLGLSREEVVLFGGLTCTPCRPSNLSDPFLTTLFHQDNFYNTPQDVYDVLTPALKLAEKFITDRTQMEYWSTLAFGKRDIDMKLTAATGYCHERLTAPVAVTDDVYAQTLQLLNRLGRVMEYRFGMDQYFANNRCFGWTRRTPRNWNLAPQYHDALSQGQMWPSQMPLPLGRTYSKDPYDDPQIIRLHPDFFTVAKRFSATKNQDVAARLRFNFWFAVNLVHEFAHVLELKASQANFDHLASTCNSFEDFKQMADPRLAFGSLEAYWGESTWTEAGGRWEWLTFGGRVHPLNGRTDASRGLVLYNADGHGEIPLTGPADSPVGVCLRMAFVEEVQQQSFWTRPQRTLQFPSGGARTYISADMQLVETESFFSQRDEERQAQSEPVTDAVDLKLADLLTAAVREDDPRPSKRRKIDDASSVVLAQPSTRPSRRPPRRGRVGQPLIRRYINKADADAAAMREEAMAQSARDEEQRGRQAAAQRAAAEEARRYRSPSPGQRPLHDFFAYPGEEDDEPAEDVYVDPASKKAEDLTREDKWSVAEEFTCLAMGWEPVEFQAQRLNHPEWRPVAPYNPDDEAGSFTQEALDILLRLRTTLPGESWPERRAQEKALYAQKQVMGQRLAEMDELTTYMGYSRIECHRMFDRHGAFPMGMTLANFPAYRPMLDAFRLLHLVQHTADYRSAVTSGQVSAAATGVGLVHEDSKLAATAPPPCVEHTPKITDFFTAAAPVHVDVAADPRASSTASTANTGDVDDDAAAALPTLTQTRTPEAMLRSYEAWVAAGADMRRPPAGLHPTQLLSKRLGGSLRTLLPGELRGVVERRARRLELEAEAERRERRRQREREREARARADAAEERRGRDNGDGEGEDEGEGDEDGLV